jgi:UDP-N-acetylmuramoyl-L-alanyl-D-glutamate--2,6-diaminopimelate ligase
LTRERGCQQFAHGFTKEALAVLARQEGELPRSNAYASIYGKEAKEMQRTQLQGGAISLRQTLPKARFLQGRDIVARSCSADWRACRRDDLFVAITTVDDDGHEHVAEAIERGAAAVIAERLLPVTVPQILVRDSRVALSKVCQALAGNPSSELRTVGIAGSAGKTITAMLVASVFESAQEAAGVMSSLGHSDSVVQRAASDGTPTAPEFASWLARMRTAGCESAVLELSSRALAERRVCGIKLDAGILTNIQNEQLTEHNSARAYQMIKRRIFRMLKPGGVAIVNADDHRCRGLLADIEGACLTYALHQEADITANVIERHRSEQTFLLSAGSDAVPVRTRMIGDHHISNCLAATAVGLAAGLSLETIVRGLEAVDYVPGRLERLECGQPFSVFVDAADSPQKLAIAIKSVRQVTSGRVLVVFGPGEGTDAPRRALMGRVIERGANRAILTSDEPCCVEPLQIAHDVLDGFERPHKGHTIPDRAAAIRYALGQARPGDCVLVAGRGDRLTRLGNSQAPPYDDREVAKAWLYDQDQSQLASRRFRVIG